MFHQNLSYLAFVVCALPGEPLTIALRIFRCIVTCLCGIIVRLHCHRLAGHSSLKPGQEMNKYFLLNNHSYEFHMLAY